MRKALFLEENRNLALLSLILMIPAVLLCLGGIMQSLGVTGISDALDFKSFFFRPAVLMGGLFIALALNILPLIRFRFQDGNLISVVRIRGKKLHLAIVGCILLLCGIIFVYLLAENFGIFAG